jgi:hypothetical protein
MADHLAEAMQRRTAGGRKAEQVAQLRDDDDHRDPREEPSDDRIREELGDPAAAQDPDQGHQDADEHRHQPHQGDIAG